MTSNHPVRTAYRNDSAPSRSTDTYEDDQLYERLFARSPQFTVLIEPNGTVVRANAAALEYNDLQQQDVVDRSLWRTPWFRGVEHGERRVRGCVRRACSEEVACDVQIEHENRTATIELSMEPIPPHEETQLILVVGTEVTERSRRIQELEEQNERLDEFASIISHDLRNPLNVAELRLDLLDSEYDSEHLDYAQDAIDRMSALLEDLLSLTRADQDIEEWSDLNLAAVATDAWHYVETADTELHIESSCPLWADKTRLMQLFENLFRNAVEHAGSDVSVSVGTLEEGFYVEDDGSGIPADERDSVFEAGFSTSERGTGFGLSIVETITQSHGWEIAVEEGTNGGARFEIRTDSGSRS